MNDIIGLPYGTVLRAWLYFENPTERGQTRNPVQNNIYCYNNNHNNNNT